MTAIEPRPFLKSAGGKSALAQQIIERFPADWDHEKDLYVEPFLGGGAVFFALQPVRALLYDANADLVNAFWSVQNIVEGVIQELDGLVAGYRASKDPKGWYLDAREVLNSRRGAEHERAALYIFVNKTCFNGLYRVNSKGLFNTPWGHNPKAGFPSADHLRACSALLNSKWVQIKEAPFGMLPSRTGWAPWGHMGKVVVYADPPYMPTSKTSDFTAYTADGFTYADQLRLLVRAVEWRNQGAHVILSQAADESLIDQYRRCGFTCDLVQARRNINSKGSRRGPVGEYILY